MTSGPRLRTISDVRRPLRSLGPIHVLFILAAWLFVVCVVIQVFLVGLDIFAKVGPETHRSFAYLYGWLAPILVLLSRTPYVPARTRAPALALLLLFAVQTVLPSLREQYPILAALHPVNALAIFALGIIVARRASTDVVARPADSNA